MKIGFAKIGRSWEPRRDHVSTIGGDVDVINSLHRLLAARPNDTFVLVGKTQADPRPIFGNERVIAPWWDGTLTGASSDPANVEAMRRYGADLDALVIWLGQIGGAASPIPKLDGSGPIKPLQMDVNYAYYLTQLVNTYRRAHRERDIIWLVPDARNRLSLHDFEQPPAEPLLAQYDMTRKGVHYWPEEARRRGNPDPTAMDHIRATHRFRYAGLELTAVPEPADWPIVDGRNVPFGQREAFGVIANENLRKKPSRAEAIYQWIVPVMGAAFPLHGKWTDAGIEEAGVAGYAGTIPHHALWPTVRRWRATFTMPASGSGWATSKPWEMFAAGVVCFFHPAYDDQGHIIPLRGFDGTTPVEQLLTKWLRPATPEEFAQRLQQVLNNAGIWNAIIHAQHMHLVNRFQQTAGGTRAILDRLESLGR